MTEIDKKPSANIPIPMLATKAAVRRQVAQWRGEGNIIALVPTMDALHAGHLSLVETARKHCDRVIVSIFVNPAQFGPNEDFDQYPRNEAADIEALGQVGADAVYVPSVKEIYGTNDDGFSTSIRVNCISEVMEGAVRPSHFDGVALVVTKLLLQSMPDMAVFGEKDYQQLQVIKRLVKDLDIPVGILASPLIRQPDGVAMSSRNAYLKEEQKSIAPKLNKTLRTVSEKIKARPADVTEILDWGTAELLSNGFDEVDYLDLRDPDSLTRLTSADGKTARLIATVRLGSVRLLDNIEVTS